jgi:hypothetical protein
MRRGEAFNVLAAVSRGDAAVKLESLSIGHKKGMRRPST